MEVSVARLSSLVLLASAAAVVGTYAASAQAQDPVGGERTISAIGVGQVRVTPANRRSNDSIRRAVEAAQEAAIPVAIAEGREYAEHIAEAAGLTLGPIVAVAQTPPSPYGPFYGPGVPPFGPGRYCGTVRRPVFRRDPATGRRQRRGTRSVRTCQVPRFALVNLTVTFAAS
jgi:uncharacterized protein YggE